MKQEEENSNLIENIAEEIRKERLAEAHEIYKRLLESKVVCGDFDATYYGCFESQKAFIRKKLFTADNTCVVGDRYSFLEYSEELFSERFVFVKGHVFKK